MTEKQKKNIHIIYSIVLSIILVVAGCCLITACVGIYNAGDRPFTPESVAAAFATIAVPVYICVGLVLSGFVLQAALGAVCRGAGAKTGDEQAVHQRGIG